MDEIAYCVTIHTLNYGRVIRRLAQFILGTGFINLRNKIHLSNGKENKNTKLNLLGRSLVNKANSKPKPNYASY